MSYAEGMAQVIRKGVSRQATDLTGRRFDRLLVLGRHGNDSKSGDRLWTCKCDCGETTIKRSSTLKRGRGKSCGCLRRELAAARFYSYHEGKGWRRTRETVLLADAKRRAKDAGLPFNLDIGDVFVPAICPALGIPLSWDAGPRGDGLPSIDRIKPDLGYIKGNVAIISYRANRLKNNATLAEIEGIVRYMKAHQS